MALLGLVRIEVEHFYLEERYTNIMANTFTQTKLFLSKTCDNTALQRRKGADVHMDRDFRNRPGVVNEKYAICQPRVLRRKMAEVNLRR